MAQSFSDAMATSVLLPAFAFLIGFVAVLFFEKPRHQGFGVTDRAAARPAAQPATEAG